MSPAVLEQKFRVLSPYDPIAVRAFEHSFYYAFAAVEKQNLIRQIWHWHDDDKRISLKVPYSHTIITAYADTIGDVIAYVAGSSGHFSQFAFYGFEAPAYAHNYFEVAALFATEAGKNKGIWLNEQFIKPFCIPMLLEHGYHCMLATCAPRLLPMYVRWGWKLIQTNTIDGEVRHFLYFDLNTETQNSTHHLHYVDRSINS